MATKKFSFKKMISCARAAGVRPGKKWSAQQRSKVKACMSKSSR